MANKIQQQNSVTEIPEPPVSRFLFANTNLALLWLVLRLYIAWQWLEAGYGKVTSPAWVGPHAGAAVKGFIIGALKKSSGEHPDVSSWYANFLHTVALPHVSFLSHLVAFGEITVGILLFLGLFTGIAAFLGAFMNMNYLFSGTVSINPIMFIIELILILAWRTAGWIGLDIYVLPLLGTPWFPGKLFKNKK